MAFLQEEIKDVDVQFSHDRNFETADCCHWLGMFTLRTRKTSLEERKERKQIQRQTL